MELTNAITLMKYKEAKTQEERNKVLSNDNYCLTLKRDGASYLLSKLNDGSVHLYSGGVSKKDGLAIDKIDNVPYLKDYAINNMPNNSMILGEICYNFDFTDNEYKDHSASKRVTSIMGSLPQRAIDRQAAYGNVEYYMFDLLYWDGVEYYKKDFIDRHTKLEEIHSNINIPKITISQIVKGTVAEKEDQLSRWFANGEEGAVCMKMSGKGSDYVLREIGETSLRRDNGIKIKTMSTFDVVISDVIYPTKEYNGKNEDTYEYRDADGNAVNRLWALGMINAFEISYYGEDKKLHKIGTVASGLTDEIRKTYHDMRLEDVMGQVIEVRCMSADKDNLTLRHPVFIQFRNDKLMTECTKENIFD